MMGILEDFLAYWPQLLNGLWVSIRLALLTFLIGIPGGLLLAIATMSKKKALRYVAVAFVEIGRGTPALVVLQVVYFGMPFTLTAFISAGIALGLTTASYTSEIIRGGLQAVPQGEVEAAHALGMKPVTVMRDVIIPQGMRIALPALVSFCVIMFQATTLAFSIAVPELMSQAKSISSATFHYFNLFVIVGVMYGVITITASALIDRLELRMSRHLA